MKMFLKRFCSGVMAVVIVFCFFPTDVIALSAQEQEDIYRVDTWWQDEYNQQYIDWLLESDSFLYHLDITTGNIIHDISYESLNLNSVERKNNFVKILTAIIDYSYETVREGTAQESANALTSYFFESFEEYLMKQPDEAKQTVEIICKASNLASMQYLDYYYLLDSEEIQLGYEKMLEYINLNIDYDTLPEGAATYFEAYITSSDWLEKWNAYSTMFSVVGESINILTDSFDIAVELESYQKTDEKFVELLKYVHSVTDDPALKAACVEVYTKLSNDYNDNFVAAFVERVGEGAVNVALGILKDCASDANLYVRCITFGYDAGTLVSNWFFNTDDTKKHMQSIYCLNVISEIVVPLLQKELNNLHYYDSPSEFSAKYAADTIYHMQALICLRRLGEESYYNLKDSAYSSLIVQAINGLPWVSSKESEQIIEDWYSQFLSVIDSVEGSLYKMIPAYYYYKQPEPDEFEYEGARLVSYNGISVNVYIPTTTKYNTIDSYAFNGNTIVESVNVPHTIKTINANAFYNCANLKSVTINFPETVITDGAFVNCHEDFTIYGYNNSTAQTYAVANGFNFISLDNEYKDALNYVDSDFVIVNGVLTKYLGDGGDVYIPYGVTRIDDTVFYGCSSLISITIPDSVTEIGGRAFEDCNNLVSVHIPDGLIGIGNWAFASCGNLTNINIPNNIKYIGYDVFSGCGSLDYNTYDNARYLGDENNPYVILVSANDDIPDCTIHKDTKFIGDNAFFGCTNLETITIPNKVVVIGYYAFGDCTNLASVNMLDGVVNIREGAFIGCKSLIDVTIPESVTVIDYDAFRYCINLTNVSIPNSVKNIGECAFGSCISLTDIVIPNSVINIGEGAFAGCRRLKSMVLPFVGGCLEPISETAHLFGYIFGEEEYSECYEAEQYYYSYGVRFACTYYIPSSLESITITGGDILKEAFINCDGLVSVVLPDGLTSIEPYTFYSCSSLTSITIPDSVTSIGNNAFSDCDLKNISIPNSVCHIGSYAFSGCNFTNIIIPNNINMIEDNTFENCENLKSVTIPNGLTIIGDYAFHNCDSLTDIYIPESVTKIGCSAFKNCDNLTGVEFSNGVCYIDERAFYNCDSLKTVFIPKSVVSIGSEAFDACGSLTHILVDEDNTSYSSDDCGVLFNKDKTSFIFVPKAIKGSYIIPNSVTNIGSVFQNCTDLTSLYIGNGIVKVSYAAFYGCSNLVSVFIPDCVTSVAGNAFYNCNNLTDINIPNSVTQIGEKAFYNCTNLKNVMIPDSITYIGDNTFDLCDELTIIGSVGSYAETYARNNNIPFVYANVKSVSVCALPNKTVYPTNGVLITDGLALSVTFEDGTQTVVTTGYTIGGYDFSTMGIKSIMVSYGELAAYFDVVVCDHNFGEWLEKIQPTCTKNGIESRFCSICSYEETQTVAALEHKFSTDWTIDIAPTCTTSGSKSHHCINCNEKTDVTEISASHQWSEEWTVDIEPTETTEGSKSRHCTSCDAKTDVTVIPMPNTESPATDFEYSIRNGEVRITDYIGTNGTMNIPVYIENYPVTTIAAFAFSGNTTITKVSIPDTVKTIEYYAFNNCTELLAVDVGNGITEVPQSAFSGCSNLINIVLPETITSIGVGAFYSCTSLTSIDIGDKVVSIGDRAFYNCTALTEIIIPEVTSTIGSDAFYGTPWFNGLSGNCVIIGNGILMKYQNEFGDDIQIPEGVRAVYGDFTGGAFEESYVGTVYIPSTLCSWNQASIGLDAKSFVVNEGNTNLCVLEDVLYSFDMTLLIAVPSRKTGTISLPETVRYIEANAFESSQLDSAVLNEGLLVIGEEAFYFADVIVNIPDTVVSIGENAFCYNKAITEIIIPSGVQQIEGWTFSGCSSLEKIVLPKTVTNINSYAFYNCTALTDVYFAGTQSQWEAISVETNNDCLVNANVHYEQETLPEVSPSEDFVYSVNNNAVTITDYVGDDCEVIIPSSLDGLPVTTIGVYAFSDCASLTKVIIPSSVTVIGNWAFSNCTALNGITITDNITYIGMFAFNNCISLTDVTIGDGVVTIGESAFSNCTGLINIYISQSVANIGDCVFSGCNSLEGIWVDLNNLYYSNDNQGVLYNKSKTKLIRAPGALTSITIPDSVTSVGVSAFSYSNALTTLVVPCSVSSIGEYAFYNCDTLVILCEDSSFMHTYAIENEVAFIANDDNSAVDLEKSIICTDCLNTEISDIMASSQGLTYSVNAGILGTGALVDVMKDGVLHSQYTLVVNGDINGDSVCNVLDVFDVERASNGHIELEGAYAMAADSNSDNVIDINDYQSIVNKALAS